MAQSYSGNWPVNVALPPNFGHTAWTTLVGGTLPYGTFQFINHLLIVTIQSSGDSGQNAGLVFVAPASNGKIDSGIFENVYGGEDFLSGALTFGKNGGC